MTKRASHLKKKDKEKDESWVTDFPIIVEDLRPDGDFVGETDTPVVKQKIPPGVDYGRTLTWPRDPHKRSGTSKGR